MLSDPDSIPICIVIALILLFLNALLIASDAALSSASKSKLKQVYENDKRFQRTDKLISEPKRYRYINRGASLVLCSAATVLIWILPYSTIKYKVLSMIAYAVIMISIFSILPSKLARQDSEKIAIRFSGIQSAVSVILLPISAFTILIANIFVIIFRKRIDIDDKAFSEDDVMSMLEEGQQSGALMEEGKKMIGSIFEFDDELAYEIMTPRTDVFLFDINDSKEEYMDELLEMKYSRIPVCEDEPDNIIGILNLKDFFIEARKHGFDNVDIKSILRKPYFVPDTKNIASLFVELQKEKQHICVLIDEYGGFSGIVTMEDILEEIVGDISDEYDSEEAIVEKIDDHTFILDGSVSLDDLNDAAGTDFISETTETVGGFIINLIGEIPSEGTINEVIKYKNYEFTILLVKERRIERIKLTINEEDNVES